MFSCFSVSLSFNLSFLSKRLSFWVSLSSFLLSRVSFLFKASCSFLSFSSSSRGNSVFSFTKAATLFWGLLSSLLTVEVGSLYSGKTGWTKASPFSDFTRVSCLVVESVFFSGDTLFSFMISLFSFTYFLTGVVLFSLYSGKAGWTNDSPLAVTTLFTVVAESVVFTFLSWCLPNTFLTTSFRALSTSFGAPTAWPIFFFI